MTDNELLSAIANMMNKNNKALIGKIEAVEQNLQMEIQQTNKKIDTVEQNLQMEIQQTNKKIDTVEQNLQMEIQQTNIKIDTVEQILKGEIHKINLNLENNIEPRLRHIEECYTSTYDRYKVELERLDKMQLDVEVMQDVVREHGQVIGALIA